MKKSQMVFTVFTKPWPNDSITGLADRVASLGFNGAEIPVRPGFQVDPETVKQKLKELVNSFAQRDLKVYSVASDLLEPVFAACADTGVPLIRIMAPIIRGEYLKSEQRLREKLETVYPLCERYGVQVGVQEHYGDNVGSALGLRSLLDGLDNRWIGAIWDAAHDALAGLEPESGLDVVWGRLLMVNLKNAYYERTNGPEAEFAEWRRHFTGARHGLASWPRIVSELERRAYSGPVCLTAEYQEPADVDSLCRDDLVYVKTLFA